MQLPPNIDADQLKGLQNNAQLSGAVAYVELRYAEYRRLQGNPWTIPDSAIDPATALVLQNLYENRRRGAIIEAIRRPDGLCCPMCGSLASGSVDHYLPKETFPEFSILLPNLVSACSFCNSNSKGKTYKGAAAAERFVHPYFDVIFSEAAWAVKVIPNYLAATFKAEVLVGIDASSSIIVAFHLKGVLGKDFTSYMSGKWAVIPQLLRDRFRTATLTQAELSMLISEQKNFAFVSTGLNSWDSALWRGIGTDAAAQSFLLAEAEQRQATPISAFE